MIFNLSLIEKLLFVAEKMQQDIVVTFSETETKLATFKIGEVEVLFMPVYQDGIQTFAVKIYLSPWIDISQNSF
jgi:hypothetical protein